MWKDVAFWATVKVFDLDPHKAMTGNNKVPETFFRPYKKNK